MNLKTKYQYTYFIYPFVVDKRKYNSFISKIVIDSNWKEKIFNKDTDIEADSHFLALAKKRLFPTLAWDSAKISNFGRLSNPQKAKVLSSLHSCMFEYKQDNVSKGRAGIEENAIFFEIAKIKLLCFNEGICFLMLKTEIDDDTYTNFSDLLNLNYKFRNISPKYNRLKDYDFIKIQTSKFENMEDIREFISRICMGYEDISSQDIFSNRLFVYSYACLDESEWNELNDFNRIKNEFLKYQYVLAGDYASEFADNIDMTNTYSRWKYSIYGFSPTAGTVFSSAVDHFNYTKLPFYYENVYMYIMLYALYQRLSYIILLKQIGENHNMLSVCSKIQKVTKETALGQVTNAEHGMNLWRMWSRVFELNEMYDKIIKQYMLVRRKV